jgi:MFS family permease
MRPAANSSPARPTCVRYGVVAFAVGLAMVTYLDRVCIGVLAPAIRRDLGLSEMQMSWVFSAFALAYAAFEIPTAWWADRIGSRAVLTRIVIWWSAFTMATAAAWNLASLLVIRFLFGAGEAGAWPNAARVFSRWVPAGERGLVQGIFFSGAHLAGGITPGLVTLLSLWLPWRGVFLLFGGIGLLWAWAWYRWFRDEPRDHPSVNLLERERIERERGLPPSHGAAGGVWRSLVTCPNLLLICLMYFSNSYGFYFLITWLPTYLMEVRHFTKGEMAVFAGLPLLLSILSDMFGGVTTDFLARRLGMRVGRCAVGFVGFLVAAIAMFLAAGASGGKTAATLIALASASSMLTLAPSWATCIEIGGRHSAVVSATMNTSGQIGSILCPIVSAYVAQRSGNWALPLYLMAALYTVSTVCWLFIDPRKKISE